jgi:hypothetical protein
LEKGGKSMDKWWTKTGKISWLLGKHCSENYVGPSSRRFSRLSWSKGGMKKKLRKLGTSRSHMFPIGAVLSCGFRFFREQLQPS